MTVSGVRLIRCTITRIPWAVKIELVSPSARLLDHWLDFRVEVVGGNLLQPRGYFEIFFKHLVNALAAGKIRPDLIDRALGLIDDIQLNLGRD